MSLSNTSTTQDHKLTLPLAMIFLAKLLRTFGFGSSSVILALFLSHRGLSTAEVGAIFSGTIIEDAVITTGVSLLAHRIGMRRILLLASIVLIAAGLVLATTTSRILLIITIIFGIFSPAGFEGGPFTPIEQTVISDSVPHDRLTKSLSTYNLAGFAGAALGALAAGKWITAHGDSGYSAIFLCYALIGVLLLGLYALLPIHHHFESDEASAKLDTGDSTTKDAKADEVHKNLLWLAGLQSIDSFGGGFVVQSLLSYWFILHFGSTAQFVGTVFFWTNVLAAASFTLAPHIVNRIGLLRTMVFTHLPCSISLCFIPLMPNANFAAALLLARSLFSSMDVPVRQAYTMLLVPAKKRPYAASITTATRAIAQGVSPIFSGWALASAATGWPFYMAGGLKSLYDIAVFLRFRGIPLHSETTEARSSVTVSKN